MIPFLFKIWGLARPYRFRLVLGVITGIIAGISEQLMVFTAVIVYGIIFSSGGGLMNDKLHSAAKFIPDGIHARLHDLYHAATAGVQAHPAAVLALIGLIPAVVLMRGLFSYLNIYFLQWVAIRTITDLRIRLFEHLMNLSAGFFTQAKSGDLIARVTNDTYVLLGIISNSTAVIIKDPVALVTSLSMLIAFDWKLTLLSMVVMPLCLIPIAVFGRKVRKSAGNMQAQFSELTSVMSESFTGNRIIKAYNLEGTVIDQFRETAKRLVGHYMRIVRAMETPGPLMEVCGAIAVALVIFYLHRSAGGHPDQEGFLFLVGSIFAMYRPIKNLGRLHNTLEQAQAASARVFEILATENTIPEPANPKPLNAADAAIEFENVFFNYGEKEILHGINLMVKPGQMVALVGPSGSGKTTITNLLLRFYDPLKGSVKIGGVDIREVSSLDLRKQIAVVTQETVLFNETIARNIEMGRPGASQADIETAAKHAHAQAFILDKTEGYDTIVGEKGVMLSGGQRQRLAIARAILKDAPILILDEATSSLDSESARAVQAALDELMVGRTTICIAHRMATTTPKADLILVMDQGCVVEAGTHAELLARDGLYRKLYQLQTHSE